MQEIQIITHEQIDKLRALRNHLGGTQGDNFRVVQPLGSRKVYVFPGI